MTLKPCPNCGGTKTRNYCLSTGLTCSDCGMRGPDEDPNGSKWNSLPRQEDVEEVMQAALRADDLFNAWSIARLAEVQEAKSIAAYLAEWWRRIDDIGHKTSAFYFWHGTIIEGRHPRSIPDAPWVRGE
jgi:reverse gyrase